MADTYATKNNITINGPIPSNTVWPQFGIPTFSLSEDIKTDCDSSDNLAEAVLDEYGIDWDNRSGASYGELDTLDIKRMDAMTVLNLSLIEMAAKSGLHFIEPIVSPDGVVEFIEIGKSSGQITDVYYEIVTGSYVDTTKSVMVTGRRPLPDMKEMSWYPIWGENPTQIYTAQDMFNNCRKQDFVRHASIVFNDPQLTTSYDDRIDNLYEINSANPWDRIAGYVKYIYGGPDSGKDTSINYTNSANVPIKIGDIDPGTNGPDMGVLAIKPTFDPNLFNSDCWTDAQGAEVDYTKGVLVEIPDELRYQTIRDVVKDKFVKVSAVHVIGRRIQTISIAPLSDPDAITTPTKENAKLILTIEDAITTTVKLEPGKHYAVSYDDTNPTGKIPYVVFTKDVVNGDPFDYSKNQTFYVDPTCSYAEQNDIEEDQIQTGTIFPHTKLKGILVQEIWVTVDIESPSIVIYDPGNPKTDEGANALTIAENLEYYVSPIVIVEPPAPIAYAGKATGGTAKLVNQVPSTDNDPTTAQDFSDTEMEEYMDDMQGGGMAITWSFLDETDIIKMCDMLYSHLQSDVIETIYTCGPECEAVLGGYGDNDGVVNAIRYNYTDSGSYTISVTEGPKLIGNLAQIDGGPSMKMSENFSAGGVVIDMAGDNIHFKLRIDGYGERWAINMSSSILRKNDIVQCTVHNNPVEA